MSNTFKATAESIICFQKNTFFYVLQLICPVSVIGNVVILRMLFTSPLSMAFITLSDPKTIGQNLSGLINGYGTFRYILRSVFIIVQKPSLISTGGFRQ